MALGLSFESFGAEVGACRDSLYRWVKEHEEFSDAKKHGAQLNLQFWEKIGMKGMVGVDQGFKGFNASLWIFNMKNRHRWADRQEVEHTGKSGGPLEMSVEAKRKLIEDPEYIEMLSKLNDKVTKLME